MILRKFLGNLWEINLLFLKNELKKSRSSYKTKKIFLFFLMKKENLIKKIDTRMEIIVAFLAILDLEESENENIIESLLLQVRNL